VTRLRFELDPEFLDAEGLTFKAEDLKFGLDQGFIKPRTVIHLAARERERGGKDDVLNSLASIEHADEPDAFREAFSHLGGPDRVDDPREPARKWLYLQLRAAFNLRDRLSDPLGVVEEIYAEFDYPRSIESFVRYMPPEPGTKPIAVQGLFERWAVFLEREGKALHQQSEADGRDARPLSQ
jgi:hypothetical protein